MGVNEEKFGTCDITSNASCTTNAASPLIAILDEAFGIENAILNTVHGYTASQALVDGPSKKTCVEYRAAAQNIVPSSTGAAIAVTKAFTKLEGLLTALLSGCRLPPDLSLTSLLFLKIYNQRRSERDSQKAAKEKRWEGFYRDRRRTRLLRHPRQSVRLYRRSQTYPRGGRQPSQSDGLV